MGNGIIDFLKNKENYYLINNINLKIENIGNFISTELILFKIEEVVLDEKLSRREAIENILSAIKIDGINFVYLIMGDKDRINFYYGISKDLYYEHDSTLKIEDIGNHILKPNILENFMKSEITEVNSEEKSKIYNTIDKMNFFSTLEGTVGVNENDEKFKYTDKLVNLMSGDEFGFLVIALSLNANYIWNIENNLYKLYTEILPLSQKNTTESVSKDSSNALSKTIDESISNVYSASKSNLTSLSDTKGGSSDGGRKKTNDSSETIHRNGNSTSRTTERTETDQSSMGSSTRTRGVSESFQRNRNNSLDKDITTLESIEENTSLGKNWSLTTDTSDITMGGYSRANTTNTATTDIKSNSEGTMSSATTLYEDKAVSEWINYIDEVLLKRLDYGKGRGLFNISTLLFANDNVILKKLENRFKLLFTGDNNKVCIQAIDLNKDDTISEVYRKFQLPHGALLKDGYIDNPLARSAFSQYLDYEGNLILGNWISTKELSLIVSLPKKK